MNKHFGLYTFVFVSVLISFLLVDCKSARIQKEEGAFQLEKKALLWEISGNKLTCPSWLFGTIHMIDAEKFFLPEGTEEAFKSSDLICFEVDLGLMDDPAEQMALLHQSFMKDDITLKDLLNEDEYAIVEKHFQGMGIPLFLLERIKPMFLTVFADESLLQGAKDKSKLKFYEFEFMQMASQQEKNVKGLEGIEFQMGLMDSIPYEVQAKMLLEGIKSEKGGNAEMDSLIALYLRQDIEGLYRSFSSDSLARYDSLLLINRNFNWLPVMMEEMKNNCCFFAVGAGHLGGPNGVIRLLEQKGYTLKPVSD